MDYFNYTFFEILKYKIEFSSCLEYATESYELKKEELEKNISYLKNNLESGMYKEIVTSLFTNCDMINENLSIFFKNFSISKIIKLTKTKKITPRISYIKSIVDCNHTLGNIIKSFLTEEELKNKLDKKILQLLKTHEKHYNHFLYFIVYNMYICSLYPNKSKLKYKEEDIKDIVGLLKYCNNENIFDNSLKVLEKNIELDINNEFEKISNKCIELENELDKETKEVINLLNSQLEKSKNS